MSNPPVLKHFTVDTLDSNGRSYIGNNEVNEFIYHDTTSESWRRDYSDLTNPFQNNDFSDITISGTGQWFDDSTDVLASRRSLQLGIIPFDFENELFAEFAEIEANSTTATENPDVVLGSYFIQPDVFDTPPRNVFPDNYDRAGMQSQPNSSWATTSGSTNQGYFILDFNTTKEVSGFYIEPGHLGDSDNLDEFIKDYEIQVATSGDPLDDGSYTTVVSGTNPFNAVNPIWETITPVSARYVRLLFNNHGGVNTRLAKFYAYSADVINSGKSLIVKALYGDFGAGSETLSFKQNVDLTNIDNLYLDFIDYVGDNNNYCKYYIDGNLVGEVKPFAVPGQQDEDFQSIKGFSLDVSSYSGLSEFEIEKRYGSLSGNNQEAFYLFNKVEVKPTWFLETPSFSRGDKKTFPEKVYLVSDFEGLSIIDTVEETLWMRFDYGLNKMLEERPRRLAFKNGKIYLSTSLGLYVVDFTKDRCVRYDHRGEFHRSGIGYRNVESIDRNELNISSTQPSRGINSYYMVDNSSSKIIPYADIYEMVAGTNDTIGDFLCLGTSRGLVFLDENAGFFRSRDRRPVYNLSLNGEVLWYSQGNGNDTQLRKTEHISDLVSSDFVPETSYYQFVFVSDSFNDGQISDKWRSINRDNSMFLFETNVLTISGTHKNSGPTGVLLSEKITNRSFTANLKVKITDFPQNSLGGFRFGFCDNYLEDGVRSLVSNSAGVSQKKGFFLSALNTNPFKGEVLESQNFTSGTLREVSGWHPFSATNNENDSVGVGITPITSSGISIRVEDAPVFTSGKHQIKHLATNHSMEKRDFVGRVKVKVETGFVPENSAVEDNPSVFFGMSGHQSIIPGTQGVDQVIDPAMILYGRTTLSGTHFYTTGRFDSSYEVVPDVDPDLPLIGNDENSITAPYREWRIDYDYATGQLTSYIDGELVRNKGWSTQDSTQPPYTGLVFGIYPQGASSNTRALFKDFTIDYPTLSSGSYHRYGLEVADTGSIENVLLTISGTGLSKISNTVPSGTILDVAPTLNDGNLHSGGITMSADTSVGIDLLSERNVEALLLYDNRSSSSGWSDLTNNKNVELWTSEDNQTWSFYRDFNLTLANRQEGITRIPFSPAIKTRYLQVKATESTDTYDTDGSNNWIVSEIRTEVPYGLSFSGGDATSDADFRDWRIEYDADLRLVRGYVDDEFVASKVLSSSIDSGQITIIHDLTPVSSGTEVFNVEVKDFSLEFEDSDTLPPGLTNDLLVNVNKSNNNLDDYTVFTVASGGLNVSEFEQPSYINRFRENTTDWSVFDYSGSVGSSSWAISSERLVQSNSVAGKTGITSGNIPYGTHFVYDGSSDPLNSRTNDFVITLKPISNGSIGFSWCRQDEDNFYYFISSKEEKEIQVGVVISGTATSLFSSSTERYYLPIDTRYIVGLTNTTASGFSISINGRTLTSVIDETFTAGKIGLISNANAGGEYTDVGIRTPSSLPDQTRTFDHGLKIVGESTNALAVVADDVANREQGLVMVGTNKFTRRIYDTQLNRPYWFDGNDSSVDFRYGKRLGLGYHPGTDSVYVIFDPLSPYIVEANLSTAECSYLSRFGWREAHSLPSTEELNEGSAFMVHTPFTDDLWVLSPDNRLTVFDVREVSFSSVNTTQTFTNSASNVSIAFITHKNNIFVSQQYLSLVDAATKQEQSAPQNWSSNNDRFGRNRDEAPWFSSASIGGQTAAYCDYDKSIYILGGDGDTDDRDVSGSLIGSFYRYDVDKNILVNLGAPPFSVGKRNAQRLVYVPELRRLYAISQRFTTGQFYYYNVVSGEWVRVSEDLPANIRRNYPENVSEDIDGTSCFAVYNSNNRSIVIWGRGRDEVFYQYKPEKDLLDTGFYYQPQVDGLPTSSGIHRQFTEGRSNLKEQYNNETEFEIDYYPSFSTNSPVQVLDLSDPGVITISGGGDVSGTRYRHYYISSEEITPVRSFELNAKVALPDFTTDILSNVGSIDAESYFVVGFGDGLNRPWADNAYGQEDPSLYQYVELRAGVSGTFNDASTHGPFAPHLVYVDGMGTQGLSAGDIHESFSSYGTSPIDFVSEFSDYKDFKLLYDYPTDTVEAFVGGVSVGSTILRRKFDSNGVRFHFGWRIVSDDDESNNHFWTANLKDIVVSSHSFDTVENNRLETVISGSIGSYYHQRWDMTLVSGTDWVVDTNTFLPRNIRSSGFDYIASLAGIGDGHKLFELVAHWDGGVKKVGVVGDPDFRDDSSTYLGSTAHLWDDLDVGSYKVNRDTEENKVSVFIAGEETPSIVVDYEDLPAYNKQHVYYGKVNYGRWEKIYDNPTLSGTWTSSADYTGSDPILGKKAFNSTASFATLTQTTNAKAIYELDQDLGEVDLYVFYHANGFDSAKNAPYTVYAGNVSQIPVAGGEGKTIVSVDTQTDEFGNANPNTTTVRIDQRRKKDNIITLEDPDFAETSGWIFIGRYQNPTKVILTADAVVGSSSSQGFVCADAVGVDIGKYGESEATLSVGHFRYQVGQKELSPEPFEVSGVSVFDLQDDQLIDYYTEKSAPALESGDITSGSQIIK